MSENEAMTITEFLEARIAEDEAQAHAASVSMHGDKHDDQVDWGNYVLGGERDSTEAQDEFIVNWWPDRVLAECFSKRAIIKEAPESGKAPKTDAELHEASSHPSYEYATTEGQRKAWYDADTPPEGDGWERNVDAGRNGWDRFDFTEESYWRRLRQEGPRKPSAPRILRLLAAIYADHPDYREEWAL